MINVTVVLLNGSYASTALGPMEVFHSAGLAWNALKHEKPEPRFSVRAASVDGKAAESSYAVQVLPHVSIDEVDDTDVVIVPALGLDLDAQFVRHRNLISWLARKHAQGATIAGICTGAAYLAEAGLLDGRQATTHWAVADDYARRYPKVDWRPEMMITEDGRRLCSGGVTAAFDISLYLVEKFCGHDIALQCSKALLVNMPRMHQSGYAVLPLSRPHTDARIRTTELYLEENYAGKVSIEHLADRTGMSSRTFVRRFKAATGRNPGDYIQTLRISIAKEMLEDSSDSVESVGYAVGYEDIAFFRALFKRHTGLSPGEYRRNFAGASLPVARDAERSAG